MTGKNIILRAVEPSDIDLLYKWENDTSVWHISNTVEPFSKFVLEQYVMNSHQDIYAAKQLRLMIDMIKTDNGNSTIGGIDLFDFDPINKRAGVGILITKEKRGKGYASEALDLLTEYCFNISNLHQIYCNIPVDNEHSLNMFKKHKFEIIGVKKQWLFINNKWIDEYLLQLLNNN